MTCTNEQNQLVDQGVNSITLTKPTTTVGCNQQGMIHIHFNKGRDN